MKKRLVRALKTILVGVIFAVLAMLCFMVETKLGIRRHRFTAGCLAIAILAVITGVSQLFDKKIGTVSTLIIEDIFKMNSGGCVVVGKIQGTLSVGDKITIQDQYGNMINTTIDGMEINRQTVRTATDTPVGLLFKNIEPDRIQKGDTVSCEH